MVILLGIKICPVAIKLWSCSVQLLSLHLPTWSQTGPHLKASNDLIKPNWNEKDLTMLSCDKKPLQYTPSSVQEQQGVYLCADSEDAGFFMTDAVCGGSYQLLNFHRVSEHTCIRNRMGFFWHRLRDNIKKQELNSVGTAGHLIVGHVMKMHPFDTIFFKTSLDKQIHSLWKSCLNSRCSPSSTAILFGDPQPLSHVQSLRIHLDSTERALPQPLPARAIRPRFSHQPASLPLQPGARGEVRTHPVL